MTEVGASRAGPAPPATTVSPITVVTGATEGIGLEVAREFARNGHDLLLVARSARNLEQVADLLSRDFSVTVHAVASDLSTREGCDALVDAVQRSGLFVEYLVNNAGAGHAGAFADGDPKNLLALVDLNVRAVTELTLRFLPAMIANGRGGVLNIGSLAGFAPGPFQQVYYASKAYIISLTQALAHETRGTGVRVSVLTPGSVATDFHARMGTENALYLLLGTMQPEAVAKIAYVNFMCRQRVIVPGPLNMLNHVLLRLMPRFLLVPFMSLILKPRP
jgi:short-subunit dehydrogenase